MRFSYVALILLALVACGPSDGTLVELQDRAVAVDEMLDEVRGYAPTREDRMPDTGSAQFDGYSALVIDPVAALDVDDIVLLGDVTLDVTFAGGGTVTGRADNFDGLVGSGDISQVVSADGSIQIGDTDSSIGLGRPGNEWTSDYAGTITVQGETYTVSGTLDGGFFGNRTSQPAPDTLIKGIFGTDTNGISVNDNGGFAPIGFEVIGTNPL